MRVRLTENTHFDCSISSEIKKKKNKLFGHRAPSSPNTAFKQTAEFTTGSWKKEKDVTLNAHYI